MSQHVYNSRMNPTLYHSISLRLILISSRLCLGLSSTLFFLGFLTKTMYAQNKAVIHTDKPRCSLSFYLTAFNEYLNTKHERCLSKLSIFIH